MATLEAATFTPGRLKGRSDVPRITKYHSHSAGRRIDTAAEEGIVGVALRKDHGRLVSSTLAQVAPGLCSGRKGKKVQLEVTHISEGGLHSIYEVAVNDGAAAFVLKFDSGFPQEEGAAGFRALGFPFAVDAEIHLMRDFGGCIPGLFPTVYSDVKLRAGEETFVLYTQRRIPPVYSAVAPWYDMRQGEFVFLRKDGTAGAQPLSLPHSREIAQAVIRDAIKLFIFSLQKGKAFHPFPLYASADVLVKHAGRGKWDACWTACGLGHKDLTADKGTLLRAFLEVIAGPCSQTVAFPWRLVPFHLGDRDTYLNGVAAGLAGTDMARAVDRDFLNRVFDQKQK